MGSTIFKRFAQVCMLATLILLSATVLIFGILVAYFCMYAPHLVTPSFLSSLLFGIPNALALPVMLVMGWIAIGHHGGKTTKKGGEA